MKHKYIVFDWDGTLADTYPVISAAYDYIFDKIGQKRVPYAEIKQITSTLQNKDILGFVFKDKKEEAARYYYEYIEKFHTQNLKAFDGAEDLLKFCKDKNLKIFLLTNKKTKYIGEELKKLGLSQYFDKVVAAGECVQDKPHPIACFALFDGEKPKAEEVLVIGDGDADVKTAHCYDTENYRADVVICDRNDTYCGEEPTYKVKSLAEVKDIIF